MIAVPLVHGQIQSSWTGSVNNNWNQAGNWAPMVVPNNGNGLYYAVTIDPGVPATVDVFGVAIDQLLIGQGHFLNVASMSIEQDGGRPWSGVIENNGMIGVNRLWFDGGGAYTLSGSGTLTVGAGGRMGANSMAVPTLYHAAGHTIQGRGGIGSALDTGRMTIHNAGLIHANVADRDLAITPSEFTNTGVLRAANGGRLRLHSAPFNNISGLIEALDGSTVFIQDESHLFGGTLRTAGSGRIEFWRSSFSDLTNEGLIRLPSGNPCTAWGTIANLGEIQMVGDISLRVALGETLSLTGAGTFSMEIPLGIHSIDAAPGAATATLHNHADHMLRGYGRIGLGRLLLINDGTIVADVADRQLTIQPAAGGSVNNGVMRASGGGTLHFIDGSFHNNGLIQASGGNVTSTASAVITNYNAATQTLSGGSYEALNNSTLRLVGMNVQTLDARVMLDGPESHFYSVAAGTTSALAPLHTIADGGHLALRGGKTMTTAGMLTTTGIIELSGMDTILTVSENFTQAGGLTTLNDGAVLVLLGSINTFSTGKFGGRGTVHGSVRILAPAVLSPGTSPGQLDFIGNLEWDAGAIIEFDMGSSSVDSDLITVTGQLIRSGSGPWAFSFRNNGWQVGQTYDLISFGSTSFAAGDFSFTNSGGFAGSFAISGGNLRFTLTAIPEPQMAMVGALWVISLLLRRRCVSSLPVLSVASRLP